MDGEVLMACPSCEGGLLPLILAITIMVIAIIWTITTKEAILKRKKGEVKLK